MRRFTFAHAARWTLLPRGALTVLVTAFLILLTACATTTQTPTSTATPTTPASPSPTGTTQPTATTAPSATSTPPGYVVKVFFSHHPQSDSDPAFVAAVQRTSPDLGVATFALKQVFLGPTTQEQAQGYYSELMGHMGATNYCSDQSKDFTLSLDHRGTKAEMGTATVTMCRMTMLAGDFSGPRVWAMLTQTLLQFPNIEQVVVLNYQGNCFADLKTGNDCLNTPSAGYVVKVFFSHHPESDSNPAFVAAVQRTSPDLGVATFALKQLFRGPTVQEQAQGYYSEFTGHMGATNYCSDQSKDFTLSLNHRGTKAETGTATVMFCRVVLIPGDMSGFRMQAMITQTLLQFSNIQRVVILNYQGNCFNDLKGGNDCLNG